MIILKVIKFVINSVQLIIFEFERKKKQNLKENFLYGLFWFCSRHKELALDVEK